MRELIEAVRLRLEEYGIDNTSTMYNTLYVGGCSYYFYSRRGTTVIIDNVTFRRSNSQVDKIVKHILSTLKKKLAEQAQSKERDRRTEEANKIDRLLSGTGISIHGDYDKDELILTFRHPDKATIMAAADHLQDSGFAQLTSEAAPVAGEEDFNARHMFRLFRLLGEEERINFIRSIKGLPTFYAAMNHFEEVVE